jgi:hypothetical protein
MSRGVSQRTLILLKGGKICPSINLFQSFIFETKESRRMKNTATKNFGWSLFARFGVFGDYDISLSNLLERWTIGFYSFCRSHRDPKLILLPFLWPWWLLPWPSARYSWAPFVLLSSLQNIEEKRASEKKDKDKSQKKERTKARNGWKYKSRGYLNSLGLAQLLFCCCAIGLRMFYNVSTSLSSLLGPLRNFFQLTSPPLHFRFLFAVFLPCLDLMLTQFNDPFLLRYNPRGMLISSATCYFPTDAQQGVSPRSLHFALMRD